MRHCLRPATAATVPLLACLLVAASAVVGCWAWLGAPVAMPHSPLAVGEKLYCLSYAPFRAGQTPLDPSTRVSAAEIDADLGALASITDCVRTYSVDFGLDQIAGIAARHGLKVMQGLWLSDQPEKNRYQIDTAVALANRYPDTVRSLVVGNEVLLRGNMSAGELAETVRAVKARVRVPVTYADVWEFWLRNRDLASAVDFITIHILPYWEDFPVAADAAASHVEAIREKVAAAFPGKEVLIGEVGWPSAGRMREGALPSPSNQARVIQEVLALAKAQGFHVNVIEAFDQPWKRALEGTVGGHWGLLDGVTRKPKFAWGAPVSDHPLWRWQAAGGVAVAVCVFFCAALTARREGATPRRWPCWLALTANAIAGGIGVGWTIENVPLESLGISGWLRSLALVAAAVLSPVLMSVATIRNVPMPCFAHVLGPKKQRTHDPFARTLVLLAGAVMLLALQAALQLVFDPRYRDFPFAPLTAAAVPLFTHALTVRRAAGRRGAAETAGATLLLLSAFYIVPNEGLANWQSLWFCGALVLLAISLRRARAAQD